MSRLSIPRLSFSILQSMKLCRFVSGSSGFLRARSAICISNVDTSSMSLVHLMFPKCSSVFRYPPSLLIGSHGADSPTFKQYYEDRSEEHTSELQSRGH